MKSFIFPLVAIFLANLMCLLSLDVLGNVETQRGNILALHILCSYLKVIFVEIIL